MWCLIQSDMVSDLLATHFPEAERKVQLTVEQVTMDAEGLRRLIVSKLSHT